MDRSQGRVYLVGAGPGDPALLTCRGAEVLARADTVVYDGLVNPVLLDLAPSGARRIYAGKKRTVGEPLSQDAINALLVERAAAGDYVVRLKGGDPFVFGRGAEECAALTTAGIEFEVVPGVSAATAVPAYAGIPLTARGIASTVVFATGHEAAGKPTEDVDWQGMARAGTVVLFMALKTAADCCQRLITAGRAADTPAAAIYWGTTAAQRTVVSTLGELADAIEQASLRPPVLIIVGEVVAERRGLSWFERRPLFGHRVVVTRGVERAREFAGALAELGAEPVIMPVTRLLPPGDDGAKIIDETIGKLSSYHWVIFTSANAVWRFFAELSWRTLDARALGNARIACVGPATAAALRENGLFADVVPPRGNSQLVADKVLEAAGDAITGARILVPRSQHGRDEAIIALRAAGAEVDIAPVYRTEPLTVDDPTIAAGVRHLRDKTVSVIAFYAPSQVDALFEIFGHEAGELISACRIVAAIGSTTQKALERRAIQVHVVPSQPVAEVFAAEIAQQAHEAKEKDS